MRTIIITGAGTGIGQATALELDASDDIQLVLIGRRKEPLENTMALLRSDKGHMIYPLDVSDHNAVKEVFQSIGKRCDNVCGLFANAGIGGANEYGEDDRWDAILSTNLNGTYYSCMEVIPLFKNASDPVRHIVITSSCLARFAVPNYTAYITSKTGLLGLTRALAIDLADDGILVNALCPGWVDTKMARDGIQHLAEEQNIEFEEAYDQQTDLVPMNRMSEPSEIGKLVRFLMSNEQRSMTGQGIDINNGSFMI